MAEWRGFNVFRLIVVLLFPIILIYFYILIFYANAEGDLALHLGFFQDIGETWTFYVIFPLVFFLYLVDFSIFFTQ